MTEIDWRQGLKMELLKGDSVIYRVIGRVESDFHLHRTPARDLDNFFFRLRYTF